MKHALMFSKNKNNRGVTEQQESLGDIMKCNKADRREPNINIRLQSAEPQMIHCAIVTQNSTLLSHCSSDTHLDLDVLAVDDLYDAHDIVEHQTHFLTVV